MKIKHVDCPICNSSKNYKIIYKKNFKSSDINTKIFSARRIPDKIHYQLVKCNKCGLVRSTPVVNIENLSSLYEKSLLTYDDEIKNLIISYINSVKPVLQNLSKNSCLLEIGCGNGFVLEAIYKLGYKNVFGIEPSIDAVNKSNPKIRKNIITNILKPGLFKKEKFDFIFFFQTFDHIPEPNKFLKECYNLLRPGGKILSFNHDIDGLSSKILGEKSPIIDIEHTFLFNKETMNKIFQKNKFIVDKVYSPKNSLSLRHLFWLIPIPKNIKLRVLSSKNKFLDKRVELKLGNICLEGHKNEK